jgi:DNA-binding HxlR family transcriptional regulator
MSTEVETAVRILRPVGAPRLAPAHRTPARIVPLAKSQEPHGVRTRTPIEFTVDVLRGPFRPLIVWGLFWGARPFSELMRHVPGVTKRTLRRELVEMERIGLVVRDVRPDSNRRACYALSPFGETLRPVIGAMYEWGLHCAEPRRSREDHFRTRVGA